jgi:hypothetical protein
VWQSALQEGVKQQHMMKMRLTRLPLHACLYLAACLLMLLALLFLPEAAL